MTASGDVNVNQRIATNNGAVALTATNGAINVASGVPMRTGSGAIDAERARRHHDGPDERWCADRHVNVRVGHGQRSDRCRHGRDPHQGRGRRQREPGHSEWAERGRPRRQRGPRRERQRRDRREGWRGGRGGHPGRHAQRDAERLGADRQRSHHCHGRHGDRDRRSRQGHVRRQFARYDAIGRRSHRGCDQLADRCRRRRPPGR